MASCFAQTAESKRAIGLLLGLSLLLIALWFFEPAVIHRTQTYRRLEWSYAERIFGDGYFYLSLVFAAAALIKKPMLQIHFFVMAFVFMLVTQFGTFNSFSAFTIGFGPSIITIESSIGPYIWTARAVYIMAFFITITAHHFREGHMQTTRFDGQCPMAGKRLWVKPAMTMLRSE